MRSSIAASTCRRASATARATCQEHARSEQAGTCEDHLTGTRGWQMPSNNGRMAGCMRIPLCQFAPYRPENLRPHTLRIRVCLREQAVHIRMHLTKAPPWFQL